MQLPPLSHALIVKRYKRFLADVQLPGEPALTVHCANTGTMKTCWRPGASVEISHSNNPKRKLAWTLERVDMGSGWVGVHTGRTNAVIVEGIEQGKIPELSGYSNLHQEISVASQAHNSRLDIVLTNPGKPDLYIEVKNATLLDGDVVRFPDAVTTRGLKHLNLLTELVQQGHRGVILFAVNRPEGKHFSPAWDIDPAYSRRLYEVSK